MYCNSCGKTNHENSKFCQHCGTRIEKHVSETGRSETAGVDKTNYDLLWEKFVEIYNAKDEARNKFNAISSAYIWDLIERVSVNGFENFIQNNDVKIELNKQPYQTIETLKTVHDWAVQGGYKLWLAEALLDDKEKLNKFKKFSLDKFIDAWKQYDFDSASKKLSEEMSLAISSYATFRLNTFMENAPEAKQLASGLSARIEIALVVQTLNGYYAGKIENTFRK